MRIAFCADVHLGNPRRFGGATEAGLNRRCRLALAALEGAVHVARSCRCAALVVLGDLFDTARPEPQVIAAAQRAFGDMPTAVLLGNHEFVSTAPGDHALGPLDPVARVVSAPEVIDFGEAVVVAVPFRPGRAVEWLPDALAGVVAGIGGRPASFPRVLALHLGISDGDTPPHLLAAGDSVPADLLTRLAREHGFTRVFAGHWHAPRAFVPEDSPSLHQVGALAPSGWNDPGWGYGRVPVWDSASPPGVAIRVVPGPRFLIVDGEKAATVDPDRWLPSREEAKGHAVYLRVRAAREHWERCRLVLEALKQEGRIEDGEVEPDEAEARAATRSAAMEARSADTLDGALAGFVKEMPLPDGVDRAEVHRLAKQYLDQPLVEDATERLGG